VAHIIHAGDIGSPNVIAGLQRIALVIAIRGNVDTGHWAEHYPKTQMMTFGARCVYVLHDVKTDTIRTCDLCFRRAPVE